MPGGGTEAAVNCGSAGAEADAAAEPPPAGPMALPTCCVSTEVTGIGRLTARGGRLVGRKLWSRKATPRMLTTARMSAVPRRPVMTCQETRLDAISWATSSTAGRMAQATALRATLRPRISRPGVVKFDFRSVITLSLMLVSTKHSEAILEVIADGFSGPTGEPGRTL